MIKLFYSKIGYLDKWGEKGVLLFLSSCLNRSLRSSSPAQLLPLSMSLLFFSFFLEWQFFMCSQLIFHLARFILKQYYSFSPSPLTEQGHARVYTNLCIFTYVQIFLWSHLYLYKDKHKVILMFWIQFQYTCIAVLGFLTCTPVGNDFISWSRVLMYSSFLF